MHRELTDELKRQAHQLGFELQGVTPAASPGRLEEFHNWLDAGYAGEMKYLEARKDAYSHPSYVLEGCRTIVMLAFPYLHASATPAAEGIATYARLEVDYHDFIHDKLKALKTWLNEQAPDALVRGVVDTAPLLEREFAEAAGLGWVGKNTLLLNRSFGSYFFLAALLTDLELVADAPFEKGYCGTCTACLDNCPTNAFPKPYVLDANRCISYLTIEYRELPSVEQRGQLHGWLFGCDICQTVCPWNRKIEKSDRTTIEPTAYAQDLDIPEVLELNEEQFRQRYRKTPMWRSKRRGFLRNAILLAGTQRIEAAYPALQKLLTDSEPLLRSAAAWAILQYDKPNSSNLVTRAIQVEQDEPTRQSMQESLTSAIHN